MLRTGTEAGLGGFDAFSGTSQSNVGNHSNPLASRNTIGDLPDTGGKVNDDLMIVSNDDTIIFTDADTMNSKQKQTLRRVFENPVRSDVKWSDVKSLFKALGAIVAPGPGSGTKVKLKGARAHFHKPHPEKTVDKGALRSVRCFLLNAGIDDALLEAGVDDAEV